MRRLLTGVAAPRPLRVLVAGGTTGSGTVLAPLATTERYTP